MRDDGPIDVIIPAYNEEASIGKVLADLPGRLLRHVVVVDNGSTDRTAAVAASNAATVVTAARRGYMSGSRRTNRRVTFWTIARRTTSHTSRLSTGWQPVRTRSGGTRASTRSDL